MSCANSLWRQGMLPTTGYSAQDVGSFAQEVSQKMNERNIPLLLVSGDNASSHQQFFRQTMKDNQQHNFPIIDWPYSYKGTSFLIMFIQKLTN